MRDAHKWNDILIACQVRPTIAAIWSGYFAQAITSTTFGQGDAETDDFLGQILVESQKLERLEENLNYTTPGRLMVVWPDRFKTLADERPYLHNPEALANKVYGGRMGNVNPGDGWRNRGSGLIMITGADNLRSVQKITGIPVFDHPELLRKPSLECLQVCIAWWNGHIPDSVVGNVVKETRIVNGGETALAERQKVTAEAGKALS